MTDARHTPQGDTSFRTSVLRTVGGALALVVLVAAVFAALGVIGRSGDDVAAGPEPGTDDEPETDEEPDDQPGLPEDEPSGTDTEPEPVETPEEDEPEPDEAEPERAFDPAEISVQVLDGYQADGGAAAREVAATLRDEGYRIVAENPALRYDVTTVLWTAGYEEQGRQVAADIGAAEAREQPGNLSTSVQVHVVVGADRG